jgi:carboxyl-terminal processing protease
MRFRARLSLDSTVFASTTRGLARGALCALLLAALAQPLVAQGPAGASGGSGAVTSEANQVFLSTLRAILDFGIQDLTDDELWERAIEGLMTQLDDPYAAVLSRQEAQAFEEDSSGNYAGIGVQISELNGAVTITAVFRSTPAQRAGLMVGDRIVRVNEESAKGWSTEDASRKIRGEPGTQVDVWVERDGLPQPIRHAIRREQVHVPAVTADRIFGEVDYIALDRFARNAAQEVDSVLRSLDNPRGIILDLRRNPGGHLDESLYLADLFLDRGQILASTRARRPGQRGAPDEERAFARIPPRAVDVPLIVLVDGFSASASEIVAGALQDHDRALILGEPTFGKGTVQSIVPLPAGRLMRITSGAWYTPLGRSLDRPRDREGRVLESATVPTYRTAGGRVLQGGGGVFPDVTLAPDTLTAGEQAFIRAAIEAEFPLAQRIQEVAFGVAQNYRGAGTGSTAATRTPFPQASVDGLIADLRSGGVPQQVLTPEISSYLRWRLEVTLYQRLDLLAPSLEVQAERDPVLAEAVRLLRGVRSQSDLFRRAEALGAQQVVAGRR